MSIDVRFSDHAVERVKKRLGLNKKALERHIVKVVSDGVRFDELKGKLKQYATSLYYRKNIYPEIIVYNRFIYLFDDENVLITICYVPSELIKSADQQQKYKIKKVG